MVLLRTLLNEDKSTNTLVDFLSTLVKTSPFKGQVFIAGGYVRDTLLGRPSKDIDLVVTADDGGIAFANWITKRLGIHTASNPVVYPRFGTAKFNLRGVSHKGVSLGDMDIESVMTRKETYTDGSRKPDVAYGTLKQDAERRDFTVNSLMQDLTTGEILDPTGMGLHDLKAGIVRSAIDPDIIFKEDPLRMLRAVRFAGKYNWTLPNYMVKALHNNAPNIRNISAERIQDEFNKILMTDKPAELIRLLQYVNLTKYTIPEIDAMMGVTQNQYHKDDVFDHSLEVLSKTPPDLLSRLAALFHDVGKPNTRTDVNGKIQFLRHEDVGATMVANIMTRLKYPNASIDTVSNIVSNHMRLKAAGPDGTGISDKALRKFAADIGPDMARALDVMDADNKSHQEGHSMPNQIAAVRARFETLSTAAPVSSVTLPINGRDIMQHLNVKPGPVIAMLLDVVKDAYFENPALSKDAALALVHTTYQELVDKSDASKLSAHLPDTIRNPQTGNDILFKTALTYAPDHPARRSAERYLQQKNPRL